MSDYEQGLSLQGEKCTAVELSALREDELESLAEALPQMALDRFEYVSFHAPSKLSKLSEAHLVKTLQEVAKFVDGIVVHPNVIEDAALWLGLGNKLLVENMDQRKPIGRTAAELRPYFDSLPDAQFCFDLGHAQQVDPTFGVALQMLQEFGSRLAELHISEVDTDSKHVAISPATRDAFRRIASLIPESVPVIIESVICSDEISAELSMAQDSLGVSVACTPH